MQQFQQPMQQQQQQPTQHIEESTETTDKWEELKQKASEMMQVEDNIDKVLSERTAVRQRIDEMLMEVAVEEAKLQAVHDILIQTYDSEKNELEAIEVEVTKLTICKDQMRETDERISATSSTASQLLNTSLTKASEILQNELSELQFTASSMNTIYDKVSSTSPSQEAVFITERMRSLSIIKNISDDDELSFSEVIKMHELLRSPSCNIPISESKDLFKFSDNFNKFVQQEGEGDGFDNFSKRLDALQEVLTSATEIPQLNRLLEKQLQIALETLDYELRHARKQQRFDLEHNEIMSEKEKEISAELEKQVSVKKQLTELQDEVSSKKESLEKLTTKLTTSEADLQAAQRKAETHNHEIAILKKQEQETYSRQAEIISEREETTQRDEEKAKERELQTQEAMRRHQQALFDLNNAKIAQSVKVAENLPMKLIEEQNHFAQLQDIETALVEEQIALTFNDVMISSNLADSGSLPPTSKDSEIEAGIRILEIQLQEKIKNNCGERARKSEEDRKQRACQLEVLFKEGDERMKKIEKLQAQVNAAESIIF